MDRRAKGILRAVAAALVVTFITQDVLWANPNALGAIRLFPSRIQAPPVPVSVATVSATHTAQSPKTLYLIQDAHTNESAQLNIAKTLDILVRKEGVTHVFMEAGWGDASLSSLRNKASLDHRQKTARSFLRKGILSGAEYLDLASGHDLVLWGVENEELYWRSIEAYRKVAKVRADLENYLKLAEQTVEALKPRIFNPSLRLFDSKRETFLSGNSTFTEYFDELAAQAQKRGITLAYLPHLAVLRNVLEKERAVDFERAQREQIAAMQALSAEEHELLAAVSRERGYAPVKMGSGDHRAEKGFYALLRDKVKDLSAYPELSKYMEYLDEAGKIDAAKLLEEHKLIEGRIYGALVKTGDEADLKRASETLRNLKGLFALTLTPDEYASLKSDPSAFDIDALTGFLNLKIMHLKSLYERAVFLKGGTRGAVRAAREFYDLTGQRDRAFLRNTLTKMEKEGLNKAVLVAGGYHAPNLTSLLKAQNISYVSLTPQVLRETNQKRYEALLLSQEPARESAAGKPVADKIGIRLVRFSPLHEAVLTAALPEKPVLAAARPAGARLADGSKKDEPEVKSTIFDLTGRIPVVMTFDGVELRFRNLEEGDKRIDRSFKIGAIPALIKLGSDPDNDIVVPPALGRVSRNHAHISIEGDGSIYLTDVSTLGTFFGMLRIGQSQRVKLMTIPELGYGTKSMEGQPTAVRPTENMAQLFSEAKTLVRSADALMMAGSLEEAAKKVSEAMKRYSKIRRKDTDYVRRSEADMNMKLLEARQHQLTLSIDRREEKLRVFEWRGSREGQPTDEEATYLTVLREGKPTAAVSLFARDWRGDKLYLQRGGDLFGLAYPGALGPTVSGRVKQGEGPEQALRRLLREEWGIELDPRRLKRVESANNDRLFGLRSTLDGIEYIAQTGEEWSRLVKFREEIEAREKEREPNPLKRVTFQEHVGFRRMLMRVIEPSSLPRLLEYEVLLRQDKDLPIPPSDERHQRFFKSVYSYEFSQAELEKIGKKREETEAEETEDTKIKQKAQGLQAVPVNGLYEDFLGHPEKYALDAFVPVLTTAYFRQQLFGQKAQFAERTSSLETRLAGTRQKIQNWYDGRGITDETREKVIRQIEPFLREIELIRQDAWGFARADDREIENVYGAVRERFPDGAVDRETYKSMIRRVAGDLRSSAPEGERITAMLLREIRTLFGDEKVSPLQSYYELAGMYSDESHERRLIETGDDLYQLYKLFLEVFEQLTYDAAEIRNRLLAAANDPEEMKSLLGEIADRLTNSPPKRLGFLKDFFSREDVDKVTRKLVISIANSPHEFTQHLRLLLRYVSELRLATSEQQRFLKIEKEEIIVHVNQKHIRVPDEKLSEYSEKITSGELQSFDQGAMNIAYKIPYQGVELVLIRPAFVEMLLSRMEEKPDPETLSDLLINLAYFLNEIDMIRKANPSGMRDDMQYLLQAVEGEDFLALESKVIEMTEALTQEDTTRALELFEKFKDELEGIHLFRIEQQFPMHTVTLRKMMKMKEQTGGLERRQIFRIGAQLARAYQHQARTGIVNRDIKLENIIVSENFDRTRVIDLGISVMPWSGKGKASLTDAIRELEDHRGDTAMTGGYFPGEALDQFTRKFIDFPPRDFIAFWISMLQLFGVNPWKEKMRDFKLKRSNRVRPIKDPKDRTTIFAEIAARTDLPQRVKDFLMHPESGVKMDFPDFSGTMDQERMIELWGRIAEAFESLHDGYSENADKTISFTEGGTFERAPTIISSSYENDTPAGPRSASGARLAAADQFRMEKLTEAVQHLNLFFSAGGNDQAEGDMMSAFEHVGDGTDKFSGLMPAVNELADFIRESAKETTNANQMRLRLQPINDLLELIPSKPSIVFALKDYPEPFSILWPSSGEGETAGARLATTALPAGTVKQEDAIEFALEVYDAKEETGHIMLGRHRLKIEKNKQNGHLRIYGLGDEPVEVENYRDDLAALRKNEKPTITLSITDLRQELGQDVTAVDAALAEIDTSIPVVAEVDLAVFRNENSGELVFPLLVRELAIARRLNAVVLLKGEIREVEEVLSQAEAWYQKKQNFIFKKNEDIPEYYRSGKRVVIASADDEELRPGAGERYFYLKPLGEDGLHNLQAIFKTAIYEARIENLETSDPRFMRFLHAYKILLGNREIADVSEFIEVLNGANKNLSAILKYAVPPKHISLNALFRVYELMKRMAEQAA